MNHCRVAFALVALNALAGSALADADALRPSLGFTIENDAVADNDRHYTSGLRLSWTDTPTDAGVWADILPFARPGSTMRTTFALGQNIYTPTDLDRVVPDPDDRPYAGWLYLNVGLLVESGPVLDQWQIGLGVVGPSAQGEQVQDAIHDRDAKGWDAQLRDEPVLQLAYRRDWREAAQADWGGLTLDVTPHLGAALGNAYTYLNGGALVRLGRNMKLDAGPPGLDPVLVGSALTQPIDGFGWYVFGGFDARLVARNVFLDGSTFRDEGPGVDARALVIDAKLGLVLQYEDVRLAYTHVWRSKEFETQAESDHFGSLHVDLLF